MYLRYLSGQAQVPADGIAAALSQTRANLRQFSFVGFLDRMPEMLRSFRQKYGVRLKLPTYNTAKGDSVTLSRSARARMEQLLAPDYEVFEHLRRDPTR